MKNTITISFCLPRELAEKIDAILKDKWLSRSALLTLIIADYLTKKEGD